MKTKLLYMSFVLLGVSSCSKDDNISTIQDHKINVEVAGLQPLQTRVHQYNSVTDIIAEQGFALNSYLSKNTNSYFENVWTYYFVPDNSIVGQWRFRDNANIRDYYWPNDSDLNFVAYAPRDLSRSVAIISNISYNNGITFSAKLPETITDKTESDRATENAKPEFMYALRKSQDRDNDPVSLRFVHPFAAIKFHLEQSHRNLKIHYIKLHGLSLSGTFASTEDTSEANNKDYLTYRNWTAGDKKTLTIDLEKSVPDDVNYDSSIGGPYLVMPQGLVGVELSVYYTWDDDNDQTENTKESGKISIRTNEIPAWQPGKNYTYILDLGDNKEEILFKVIVEEWDKGEDDDYENSFEVN